MYSINEKTINIDDMNTKTLNCEVSTYWKQVKSANQQIKLVLISMFSASSSLHRMRFRPQTAARSSTSPEKAPFVSLSIRVSSRCPNTSIMTRPNWVRECTPLEIYKIVTKNYEKKDSISSYGAH